jgi:NADP-dependent 3-hydroxy acid dehydrogenase YdfG
VDQATPRFGRVDIVVNNAGIIQVGPMSTITMEDFANALDMIFWGTLYPTLAVLPQMRARRSGRVVNITSIGGMVSVLHLLLYTCAKFATVGLSEGLRAELGREGIRVTTADFHERGAGHATIVRATQCGVAECIFSLPTNLVGRMHGLCPGITAKLLSLARRSIEAVALLSLSCVSPA